MFYNINNSPVLFTKSIFMVIIVLSITKGIHAYHVLCLEEEGEKKKKKKNQKFNPREKNKTPRRSERELTKITHG